MESIRDNGGSWTDKLGMWAFCLLLKSQRGLFRHLRSRGYVIVLWTVNTEEEFQQMLDWYGDDIDGVMTDFPQKLNKWIETKYNN